MRPTRILAASAIPVSTDPTLPTGFVGLLGMLGVSWTCASCGTKHDATDGGIHAVLGRKLLSYCDVACARGPQ